MKYLKSVLTNRLVNPIVIFLLICNGISNTSAMNSAKSQKISNQVASTIKNTTDSDRLVTLVTANYDEIKILQMALTKNISADTKGNIQKMLMDHQKALNELKTLAAKKSIKVPTQADEKGVKKYDELNKLTGKDFEEDLLDHLISAHKELIEKLQDYSQATSIDPSLKAWCSATIPVLQMHLQMAQASKTKLSQK